MWATDHVMQLMPAMIYIVLRAHEPIVECDIGNQSQVSPKVYGMLVAINKGDNQWHKPKTLTQEE